MNLNPTKYYVGEPNLQQIFKPAPAIFPGFYDESRFSINSQVLRGDEFSSSHHYCILVIGGSTSESSYVDDAKTWLHVLLTTLNRATGQ